MMNFSRIAAGHQGSALVAVVVVTLGAVCFGFVADAAGAAQVAEPPRHVVGEADIQARIDQQVDQADADRQAIQILLQREDVRSIAGSVGLDPERASAAAATLTGSELETLAAQARAITTDLAGGEGRVVMTTTTLIIILLILILLV